MRKIAYLKGLWGGGGQTKKNQNTDGMAAQTIISTGIALCGQDKPTQDMALFTRVLFLAFSKTSFSKPERDAYEDLVAMCSLGNTHLTLEVLGHRQLFEKNFANAYSLTKSELSKIVEGEKIHDRIFGNWIIPLAAFRTLESVLSLPFSYNDLLTVAVAGMRLQNETAQESSEMGDFWEALQGFHTQGRAIDKAHFRIKWHRTFRSTSMKEDMVFAEPTPVLYLNSAAVAGLFNGRGAANATANRSNWSTMLSYLRSAPLVPRSETGPLHYSSRKRYAGLYLRDRERLAGEEAESQPPQGDVLQLCDAQSGVRAESRNRDYQRD